MTLPVASAEDQASQNATAQCGEMLLAALVTAVPYVKQEDLANNLAARLLTVVQDDARSGQSATIALAGSWLPRQGACLIGLAQLASVTKRTIRDQIVATVLQATSDTRLSYSQTTGQVSPPKRAGCRHPDAAHPLAHSRRIRNRHAGHPGSIPAAEARRLRLDVHRRESRPRRPQGSTAARANVRLGMSVDREPGQDS